MIPPGGVSRPIELLGRERGIERGHVGKVDLVEREAITRLRRQRSKPVLFQADGVVIVEVIDPDNAVPPGDQRPGQVKADKAGHAGDENPHKRLITGLVTGCRAESCEALSSASSKALEKCSSRRPFLSQFASKKFSFTNVTLRLNLPLDRNVGRYIAFDDSCLGPMPLLSPGQAG